MQQVSPVFIAIVFIISISCKSDAKRGCALYGHSCYGGHGKRSDIAIKPSDIDDPVQMNKVFSDINKEMPFPTMDMLNENDSMNPLEARNKELQYAIYDLIKQWMENKRRARNMERNSLGENSIFQRNK